MHGFSYIGSSSKNYIEEAHECTLEKDEEGEADDAEEDVDIMIVSDMLKKGIFRDTCEVGRQPHASCAGKFVHLLSLPKALHKSLVLRAPYFLTGRSCILLFPKYPCNTQRGTKSLSGFLSPKTPSCQEPVLTPIYKGKHPVAAHTVSLHTNYVNTKNISSCPLQGYSQTGRANQG